MRNEESERKFEPKAYDTQLQAILSRTLTPENIDEYADSAIDDLVLLVDKALIDYNKQPTIGGDVISTREREDAVFSYFGISGVEESLDHIAGVADSIHRLDDVIARAKLMHTVIIPTDPTEVNIVSNNGNFQPKKTTNRLKTVLFSLEQDFDVNLDNPDELVLTQGDIPEGIMRKSSYYMIDIPGLDRVLFICDEERNITYVFDRMVAAEFGIAPTDLASLNKPDLNDLLKQEPNIGCRIVYSKNFLSNVKKSLSGDFESNDEEDFDDEQYLRACEKAPEGYMSINGIAKMYILSDKSVSNVIAGIKEELGEIATFRFGARATSAYSPEQIEMIRIKLEQKGLFIEKAPEGYLSFNGISAMYSVDRETVIAVIAEIEDELGEIARFKFGTTATSAYSPDQIEMIRIKLEQKGSFIEKAPEGYLSVSGIADMYGVVPRTVLNVIAEIEDELGEIARFKFGPATTSAYSPDQIEVIHHQLERKGLLAGKAPEGYLSSRGIANMYVVAPRTVLLVIADIKDELGEIARFKFGPAMANAYSPDQIEMIRIQLEQKRVFIEKAPEGYLSVTGIADKYMVGLRAVFTVIAEIKEELGEIATFRFGARATSAYSPEQIEMITQHIVSRRKAKIGGAAISNL